MVIELIASGSGLWVAVGTGILGACEAREGGFGLYDEINRPAKMGAVLVIYAIVAIFWPFLLIIVLRER